MSAQPFDVRLASLEGSYHQVSDRLNSIDRRLDGFEQRMDARFSALESRIDSLFGASDSKVEGRFRGVDSKITSLDSKIDRFQWRMTALIVGTWISVIATILFHR